MRSAAKLSQTCAQCLAPNSPNVKEQHARGELEMHEGGSVTKDERFDRRVEHNIAQRERAEVRKVQRSEGWPRRGTEGFVASEGKLSEGVLRRGEDQAVEKGAPEVQPAI